MNFPALRRGSLAALPAAMLLFGCSAQETTAPTGLVRAPASVGSYPVGNGQVDRNEVEVCKVGSSATITLVSQPQNQPAPPTTEVADFLDGECFVMNFSLATPPPYDNVTVTETALPANTVLDSIVVFQGVSPRRDVPLTITRTVVTGSSTASVQNGLELGSMVVFYNRFVPPPPPSAQGRMTGGGKTTLPGGISITNGFTIHCDIVLSNNLEINWPGNKWHIDKPLTSALCIDDPAIAPAPPQAPFDTFFGEGVGKLNGVDGSLVKFTFIDAGEPGKNDMIQLQVFDLNNNLVLNVPLTKISNGNFQAHYDQPHKNKP